MTRPLTPHDLLGPDDGTTPNFGYPAAGVYGSGGGVFSGFSGGGTPNFGDGTTPNFGPGGGGGFILGGPAAFASLRGPYGGGAGNVAGSASIDSHFGIALTAAQQHYHRQQQQVQQQQQQQHSGAASAAASAAAPRDAAAAAPPAAPQRPQTTSTGVGDGVWDTFVNEDGSLERRRRLSDSPKGTTIIFFSQPTADSL